LIYNKVCFCNGLGVCVLVYSVDLRKRVVDAVKVGRMTQEKAAACFSVSVGSVKRWLKMPCLKAKKTGPQQPFTLSHEALLTVVNTTPDCYLDEYARQLQTSRSTVCYHLKKLAWTRKKNGTLPRKK
jgi:transposase